MDKDYINYVLDGSFTLEQLTSKNINKYKKIISLIEKYKNEYLQLKQYSKSDILDYVISKYDKRHNYSTNFLWDGTLILTLKLYRDIEFKGASALEIKSIKEEFNSYRDMEWQLEELKNKGLIEIESRGDLNQIRFIEQ